MQSAIQAFELSVGWMKRTRGVCTNAPAADDGTSSPAVTFHARPAHLPHCDISPRASAEEAMMRVDVHLPPIAFDASILEWLPSAAIDRTKLRDALTSDGRRGARTLLRRPP
ncbi:hypothetical protein [Sorangium sp. So ce887]|uniref:hypothetical protein n=1 Tax=Sorangium sp. So ce887 TaxID=3133324 RepID=UPI003F6261B0